MKLSVKQYLLACLAEEAGEVTQCVGKTLRFGISDTHPKREDRPNSDLLVEEINHIIAVAEMLNEQHVEFPGLFDRDAIQAKKDRVLKYMNYSKERGVLE